jgi:hypothetical protein
MINSNSQNENTAESGFPSAFRISSIVLTNAYGKTADIKAFVTQTTITESLYTYSLVATIEIRDTINLFEEFRISGQEKVEITFHKRDRGSKDTTKIKKVFYISEIPLFGKLKDAVQAYQFTCVSEHAFYNHVVSVSRTAKGSISKQISKIMTGDLGYSGIIESDSDSKGNVKLIIPNMKPFTAITWLLRHAYSDGGSPIYAFESLTGFKIKSHKSLTTQESIGTYNFNFLQEADPGTPEGYEQAKYKILSMSSDLNSSKYLASARGAYSSTTRVVDIATKKSYDVKFDYSSKFQDTPTMGDRKSKPLISSNFKLKDETLNRHHDSLYIYLNENSMAYDKYKNYHDPAIYSVGQHQSMVENLDSIKHSIVIHGNLDINAGKKITIEAPKSIDPQVYNKIRNKDSKKSALHDMMVSGDYLITAVKHTFGTEYSCALTLKKDYSYYTLDSAE